MFVGGVGRRTTRTGLFGVSSSSKLYQELEAIALASRYPVMSS